MKRPKNSSKCISWGLLMRQSLKGLQPPASQSKSQGRKMGRRLGLRGRLVLVASQNSPKHEDGTPESPHPSASVVPGTGEATGEEATTAAPTRFLIHNIIDGLGVTFGFLLWNLLLLRSEFEGGGEKNKKRRRRSRDVTYSL